MIKALQGISFIQVCGIVVALCVFLSASGVTLGHIGTVTGTEFLGGLAGVGIGLAAKQFNQHSSLDEVHESTVKAVEQGKPVSPKAAEEVKDLIK